MKEAIAFSLCLLLMPTPASAADMAALKQSVLTIPVGQFVEIRTTDKVRLYGRIGAATDQAVAIDTIRFDKPETQQIEFTKIKSIRVTSPNGQPPAHPVAARIGRGVLIGLAVLGGLTLLGGLIIADR